MSWQAPVKTPQRIPKQVFQAHITEFPYFKCHFFSFAGAAPEEEEVEGASRMLKVSGDTEGSYEGIS